MKKWAHRNKIKLIVGLLILATLMSTGINIYLTEQQYGEHGGGAGHGGHGNGGDG